MALPRSGQFHAQLRPVVGADVVPECYYEIIIPKPAFEFLHWIIWLLLPQLSYFFGFSFHSLPYGVSVAAPGARAFIIAIGVRIGLASHYQEGVSVPHRGVAVQAGREVISCKTSSLVVYTMLENPRIYYVSYG